MFSGIVDVYGRHGSGNTGKNDYLMNIFIRVSRLFNMFRVQVTNLVFGHHHSYTGNYHP